MNPTPRPHSPQGGSSHLGPRGPRNNSRPPSHPSRPSAHPSSFGGGRSGGGRSSGRSRFPRREHNPFIPREERSALQGPDLEREREVKIDPPTEGVIRIVPLGGVEEVGRNMTVVETPEDIFVVDMGFQFMSETDAPGIDYILPNTRYLEDRKDKIRAVIITHGHLDHIGAIPYIMPRIGNPPIYTRYLTSVMIKKRQEEFAHLAPIDIKTLEPGERITIGGMKISTFPVTHSIPDAMGVIFETKYGNIVFTGDLKLDHEDGVPSEEEVKRWTKVGEGKNILF
ncbi:MAG: ribonuclease J, partial [Patescibacteria group bacterium]